MPWCQVLEKVVPAGLLEDFEKYTLFFEDTMSGDFLMFSWEKLRANVPGLLPECPNLFASRGVEIEEMQSQVLIIIFDNFL